MTAIAAIMGKAPVIPVIVVDELAYAEPLARALVAGGLPVLEVTLRTECALDAIRAMKNVPGAIVGAGTVTNEAELDAALDAIAWLLVLSATPVMERAVASSSVAAEVTMPMEPVILASKPRTSPSTRSARRWRADCWATCSASSSTRAMAFLRNTSTALAIAPISSTASCEGTVNAISPAAM